MSFKTDLKLLAIGTSGTGKTSYVNKYTKNIFSETYKATIVSEFGFRIFENEGKLYRIQLWDLAGQDKNCMVCKIFAKDAFGCIIFSDATNVDTREDTKKWKATVDESSTFLDGGKLPCIIVENKSDLIEENEKENHEKEIKEFAENNGFIGAFLTSSKTGENVNESITFLLKAIIKRMEDMPNKGIEVVTTERKSIPLAPNSHHSSKEYEPKNTYNASDKFDNSEYNIDKIEFKVLEDDLFEICIYKKDDYISYKCEENFKKLKEKYEFLYWINNIEQLMSIFKKMNEKKKIKINLCLNEILIHISILYTHLYGDVEEMSFLLIYNAIEKEEELIDLVVYEMIKMKEIENNSEENESSEDHKDLDEEKENSKEKEEKKEEKEEENKEKKKKKKEEKEEEKEKKEEQYKEEKNGED